MEVLLIGIARKDCVTHNRENTITFNKVEQHILKNIMTKFGFGLKVPELCLDMIKYRSNLNYSLYGVFIKVEKYLDILNAKAKM